MPDILGEPVKMGMMVAGEDIASRCNNLMGSPLMENALKEIAATISANDRDNVNIPQLINALADKHNVGKEDLTLLWNWKSKSNALAHYSRLDVQEAIVSYAQGRCVSLEGMDEYINLKSPKEVSAFAEYMVGGGVIPKFWNTNAGFTDDGEIVTCDLAIKVDKELANSAALLFRSFDIPCFALYSGDFPLWIIMPFELIKMITNGNSPLSKVSDLALSLGKYLRRALNTFSGVNIYTYETSIPMPYSIADDGVSVYVPVKLEDVYKLSPEMAMARNIGTINEMKSFVPLREDEKVAEFFSRIII